MKFYYCEHCKNVAVKCVDKRVPIMCCGEVMKPLDEKLQNGALEKHLPKLSYENGKLTVCVGEVLHPMTEDHLIEFVYIKTNTFDVFKKFEEGDVPQIEFAMEKQPCTVYAYCNLHGLFVASL